MILAGDPTSDMTEIFRRDEFQRTPSWWDRLTSAIGDFFGHLSFGWLGPVGQFILWLLLVVAVGFLVLWLVRRWRSRAPRVRPEREDVVPIEIDTITDPEELRARRTQFEGERDYQQAILTRYRELVAVLMRGRLVTNLPGRTTGELRADLAASTPEAGAPFDRASTIFEVTWFSDHRPTAEEYGELHRLAEETLRRCGLATEVGS